MSDIEKRYSAHDYCGHWSVEQISRTMRLKRTILRNYHREADGLVEEIGWMAEELERRALNAKEPPS